MRRATLAVISFLSIGVPVGSVMAAEDCSKDVVTAIQKQRASKAFRIETTQPTAEGPVKMTVDYLPPDRMLQTVVGDHMPGEQQTMLVGDRAFAGSSGAYEELLPHFTQSIVGEMKRSIGPVEGMADFACAVKETFEGKELLAYRAIDKAAPAGTSAADLLARTIYVDPTSGLPAFNVVAKGSGKGEVVMKVSYSYPTDIVIEAPQGAPVQKTNR
jgi:hypothetical protein